MKFNTKMSTLIIVLVSFVSFIIIVIAGLVAYKMQQPVKLTGIEMQIQQANEMLDKAQTREQHEIQLDDIHRRMTAIEYRKARRSRIEANTDTIKPKESTNTPEAQNALKTDTVVKLEYINNIHKTLDEVLEENNTLQDAQYQLKQELKKIKESKSIAEVTPEAAKPEPAPESKGLKKALYRNIKNGKTYLLYAGTYYRYRNTTQQLSIINSILAGDLKSLNPAQLADATIYTNLKEIA